MVLREFRCFRAAGANVDECKNMEYNEMKREEDWVIEAQNVSYTYDGNTKRALDGLNLRIRRGTKVAFMAEMVRGSLLSFSA